MAAIMAWMEAMIEQLKASGKSPTLETSTSTNFQYNSSNNPTTFPPFPYAMNLGGITAPQREMSTTGVYANSNSIFVSHYALRIGKHSYNIVNPLAPQNMLQDTMMSTLNPTVIAYIANMVNRQSAIAGERKRVISTVTKPYPAWVESITFPTNFKMSKFKMFNSTRNPPQYLAHYISKCGPDINGLPVVEDALLLQVFI